MASGNHVVYIRDGQYLRYIVPPVHHGTEFSLYLYCGGFCAFWYCDTTGTELFCQDSLTIMVPPNPSMCL